METNNLNLKKFNLEAEANDTMNVETYFNNNWDKIDEKVGSMSGLVTEEKDSLTGAINELKQRADDNRDAMEKSETVAFEMDGAVGSYPEGAKGMFSPVIEGVEPLTQLVKNGDFKSGADSWNKVDSATITIINSNLFVENLPAEYQVTQVLPYNILRGDKLFIYAKTKADFPLEFFYYDGIIHRANNHTGSNNYEEQYGFIEVTNTFDSPSLYFKNRSNKAVNFYIDGNSGVFAINMTACGIEHYNEDQMLAICRQGYWEGLKTPAQYYELVSRSENLFDGKWTNSYTHSGGKSHNVISTDKIRGITGTRYNFSYKSVKPNTYFHFSTYDAQGNTIRTTVDSKSVVLARDESSFSFGVYNVDGIVEKDISCVQITKGSSVPTHYTPYMESKTEISLPRRITRIDDVYDEILENREMRYRISKGIVFSGGESISHGSNPQTGEYELYIYHDTSDALIQAKGKATLTFNDGIKLGYSYANDNGKSHMYLSPGVVVIWIDKVVIDAQSGATVVDKFRNYLEEHPATLKYQLAQPVILEDSENGYKAPTSIQSFKNGDLITKGLYSKIHNSKGKTITIEQPMAILEKVTTIIGGGYRQLNAKLINKTTVELKDDYIGKVLIEGELESASFLYPKVRGNISSNVSAIIDANKKASSNANEKLSLLKKRQEVLIANSQALENRNTIPFELGEGIKNNPLGAKGLFSPKIEGVKPLFNLNNNGTDYENWSLNSGGTIDENGLHLSKEDSAYITNKHLKDNTLYTIVALTYNSSHEGVVYYIPSDSGAFSSVEYVHGNGVHVITIMTDNKMDVNSFRIGVSVNNDDDVTGNIKIYGIYEGDQTNNPNILHPHNYGLIPSAQNYELLSRGINITDYKTWKTSSGDKNYKISPYIQIPKGANVTFSFKNYSTWNSLKWFDVNKNLISQVSATVNVYRQQIPDNAKYIRGQIKTDGINLTDNDEVQIIYGLEKLSAYIPYNSLITEVSFPEEYPLVELPNGVKNYVNEDGDYIANIRKVVIDDQLVKSCNSNYGDIVWIRLENFKDWVHYRTGSIEGKESFVIPGVEMAATIDNDINSIGKLVVDYGESIYFYYGVAKGTSLAEAREVLTGKTIYYQLAQPRIFKDGENGYKAPSSIEAFENGDLVVTGLYSNVHTCNGKTITLDQPIISLKNVYAEVDGEYKVLEATLTNETTVTLTENFNGEVLVKGHLDPKCYINPKITADIPANLGTLASSNSKAISHTNEKLISLQDKLDLLMVMNS